MICQDFNLSPSSCPCCLGFSISHQKKFAKQKTTGARKLKSQVVKGINSEDAETPHPLHPPLFTPVLSYYFQSVYKERGGSGVLEEDADE